MTHTPQQLHSGNTTRGFESVWTQIFALLLLGGVLLGGWRAAATIAGFVGCWALARCALLATLRRPITLFQWPLDPLVVLLLLPGDLAGGTLPYAGAAQPLWPVIPAAAILLALAQEATARLRLRVQPAVLTVLTLHLVLGPATQPRAVVDLRHLIIGDALRSQPTSAGAVPWFDRDTDEAGDTQAFTADHAAAVLADHVAGRLLPGDDFASPEALVRDRLPPMEDVVFAGHPMPMGQPSLALLAVLVCYGCYRGVMEVRIAALALLACYAAMLLLPLPVAIERGQVVYRLAAPFTAAAGPGTIFTLIHYFLLATPAPLTLAVLANLTTVRPRSRRLRWLWSLALGLLTAVLLLYWNPILGPLLALLVMAAVAPLLTGTRRPLGGPGCRLASNTA